MNLVELHRMMDEKIGSISFTGGVISGAAGIWAASTNQDQSSGGLSSFTFSAVVDYISFIHIRPDGSWYVVDILANPSLPSPGAVDISVSFTKGGPSNPSFATVTKTQGRGPVTVDQQPAGGETIIKIDDADPGSTDTYSFTVNFT
jgi:hypothetical protein